MTDLKTIARTCLASSVRHSARAVTRHYDRALAPYDLKISQFSVLVAAALACDDTSISQVAEALGLERSSLSRNLGPLERRGLIVVGPERRHRARRIHLTEAGAALLAEAQTAWRAVQAEMHARLGDDRDAVFGTLQKLAEIE